MCVQRPQIPARRIAGSVPAAPTRDRTVKRRRGLRVPNFGENRQEFVLRFGELHEDGCLQRRPAASAVDSVQLPEGRQGTAPVAADPPASRARAWPRTAVDGSSGADGAAAWPDSIGSRPEALLAVARPDQPAARYAAPALAARVWPPPLLHRVRRPTLGLGPIP